MIENLYTYDKDTLELTKSNKYNRLLRICVWLVIINFIQFVLFGFILLNEQKKILYQQNTIEECNIQIDEIQNICNYENVVKYKAGEYAMHPHKLSNTIDDTSVSGLLTELNAWYPDIKMAQIKCESNFGLSKLAKQTNNICGMRKTSSRETTQIKKQEHNGYGVYNNWESCVIDMVLWDRAIFGNRKPTRAEYINRLNNIYSETIGYGNTVDGISNKYKHLFN